MDDQLSTTPLRGLFFGLTLCLVAIQLAFYLPGYWDLLQVYWASGAPTDILPTFLGQFAHYAMAYLLLWLMFNLLIWAIVYGLSLSLKHRIGHRYLTMATIIWFVGYLAIWLLNLYYFPSSIMGVVFGSHLPVEVTYYLGMGLAWLMGMLAMLSAYGWLWQALPRWTLFGLMGLLVVLWGGSRWLSQEPMGPQTKPHVILIGIDSLDLKELRQPPSMTQMPWLRDWLTRAHHFEFAVTPLARTGPAWASVLTSANPVENGIRFNLMDDSYLQVSDHLCSRLRALGYQTVFASDGFWFKCGECRTRILADHRSSAKLGRHCLNSFFLISRW